MDDASGEVAYVEHHRTLEDWVRVLAGHGFAVTTLLEPTWPADHDRVWGGWSRTRGRLTPGTAIFGADLLGAARSGGLDRGLAAVVVAEEPLPPDLRSAEHEQHQAGDGHRDADR